MIVALAEAQLLEIVVDAFTDGVRCAEIHRCALHLLLRAVGNGCLVGRQVIICVDLQQMVAHIGIACTR